MSDNGGSAGLAGEVKVRPQPPEITDKVCPNCLLFMVRWGKTLFCPRCARPNGSAKQGSLWGRTRSPRASSWLASLEHPESEAGGTGDADQAHPEIPDEEVG